MSCPTDPLRRSAGALLCLAGGALIAYAGYHYAAGWYRADQARAAWDERDARAQVAIARARAEAALPGTIEGVLPGAPVARLVIPRIGLDEIVLEGVGGEELNASPGHLPGSAFPGLVGNAVISAHRDRHFSRLGELQIGDTITTESGHSADVWVVVSRHIVGAGTPALFQTKQPTLTLTTCWPIRYFGSAPDRLILTARSASTLQATTAGGRENTGRT